MDNGEVRKGRSVAVTSDIRRMKRDMEQVTDGTHTLTLQKRAKDCVKIPKRVLIKYVIVLLLLCPSVERVGASRIPDFFLIL